MTSVSSNLELRLKNAGFSLTKPRLEVFKVLQTSGPLTMHDLYVKLENQVNRTTVYRVIELFEELNISQKVAKGWKYQLELTDEFEPHHHHFTCANCHKMINFDEPEGLEAVLEDVGNRNGFSISGHSLEIEGLCFECLRASAN